MKVGEAENLIAVLTFIYNNYLDLFKGGERQSAPSSFTKTEGNDTTAIITSFNFSSI